MSVNPENKSLRPRRPVAPVKKKSRRTALAVGAAAGLGGLAVAGAIAYLRKPEEVEVQERRPMSLAERTGSLFLPAPASLTRAPQVERLTMPIVGKAQPIWGATGRDLEGNIWFGVTYGAGEMGVHLVRYEPRTRSWLAFGSSGAQMRRLNLQRSGEMQRKFHTRIVPADDGWMYFATTDEEDEREDGSALPRWGGHLWRMKPGKEPWEHRMAAPEGLIAASGAGRYVYVLGYWGHVLYQHDTQTGQSRRLIVGSVGGHISRNFLSDVNGHAYVPRVSRQPDGQLQASLVEFDADLRELAATPLAYYLGQGTPEKNHGIIGISTLPSGRLVFTTARGHLYLIEPSPSGPAKVSAMGWFHPAGEAYAPSLFAYGGGNLLAGVTRLDRRHEWVVYELLTQTSVAQPLDLKGAVEPLLYGSQTRDDEGGCYLVGGNMDGPGKDQPPLVLRVMPPKA